MMIAFHKMTYISDYANCLVYLLNPGLFLETSNKENAIEKKKLNLEGYSIWVAGYFGYDGLAFLGMYSLNLCVYWIQKCWNK